MKKINLFDVCEISAGQSAPQKAEYFSEDGYPFVRAGSLEKLIAGNKELEHINYSIGKKLRLRLFPQNTILFAKSGMSAKIGRVFKLQSPSFVVSHLATIIPDLKKIEPNWLKRWFEFNPPSRLIPNDAYPSIKLSEIARLKIPVVALEKQKQFSTVLDTADTLRQKRKEQLSLLDDYLKSVFFEMFGDPVVNIKNWYLMNLRDVSEKFSDGPFGSNLKTEHYQGSGVRIVRLQNIGLGKFNNEDKAFISEVHYENIKKHTCKPGDVLIATMGDPNIRACILPRDINIAINKADCIQLRPRLDIIASEYICSLLNSSSAIYLIAKFLHGQTRTRISMGQLSNLRIPVPPIKLQKNFASIVEQVEQTKQKMRASLEEMDNHFNALMQRYFG